MPARITKIPESWKKTHKLVDGKLVKKPSNEIENKKLFKKKKEDHPLVVLLVFIGIVFFSCQQTKEASQPNYSSNSGYDPNSPEYIESVQKRSNVGETIDSLEEIVDACMVIVQDQGKTYREARKICS